MIGVRLVGRARKARNKVSRSDLRFRWRKGQDAKERGARPREYEARMLSGVMSIVGGVVGRVRALGVMDWLT